MIKQVADEERREPSDATGTAAVVAGWSHGHRDVSGGWLRPTVFGAVDGLVTNASLIAGLGGGGVSAHTDRKSTRLNSSHTVISYAVFCLKKKKKTAT